MYDFKLDNDEEIEIIDDNASVRVNDTYREISVVITNKRLIVLALPTDLENFRFGREIIKPFVKETILEKEIDKIIKIDDRREYIKYIFDDDTYVFIKSKIVYEYLKKYCKQ